MKELTIKPYARILFGIIVMIFVFNKLYLRPLVAEDNYKGLILLITNSLPNLLEAIMGTLIVTGILVYINQFLNARQSIVRPLFIYIAASVITAVYVLSQELKFHNLGGNNVYDINDVIASIIGLILTLLIICKFGFVKKKSE